MAFIENKSGAIVYMTAPNISVSHAFTTRLGGVSRGTYSSLNLGQNRGDDDKNVIENYSIICRALGITEDSLICSSQVHGDYIRVVTNSDTGKLFGKETVEADGLISSDLNTALAVFTADCVPILLHDPKRRAIGAVHAGWRGTALDIAGKAVKKMELEFGCRAADIKAAIGPCISKCCFETDTDVPKALRAELVEAAEDCISAVGRKFYVDLKEANRRFLIKAGICGESIEVSDECTSCHNEKYWSHRRTEGARGSQAAIITLKGSTP